MHPKDADGMANSVDPDQTASSEMTYCAWEFVLSSVCIRDGSVWHYVRNSTT